VRVSADRGRTRKLSRTGPKNKRAALTPFAAAPFNRAVMLRHAGARSRGADQAMPARAEVGRSPAASSPRERSGRSGYRVLARARSLIFEAKSITWKV